MFSRTAIHKPQVLDALRAHGSLYQDAGGRRFLGKQCALVPVSLRSAGWTQIPLDLGYARHLRKMDLEIVKAQLVVGGVPTGRSLLTVVERYVR